MQKDSLRSLSYDISCVKFTAMMYRDVFNRNTKTCSVKFKYDVKYRECPEYFIKFLFSLFTFPKLLNVDLVANCSETLCCWLHV